MIDRRFLADNFPFLLGGSTLLLASSFGQTFFIALFAGHLRAEYGLSNGQWGLLYTVATLASAALLIHTGKYADQLRIRTLALMVIVAYVAIAVAMANVNSVFMLGVIIFGLRFCGQGMMSHLGMTAMGRWFVGRRGQAVAIASLGFSIGEAILPMTFVALTGILGWRHTWLAIAFILALFFAPLILWLLRLERTPASLATGELSTGIGGRHWTRGQALRHRLFWVLMPGFLAPSFISTSVMFHQVHLTEIKGWELAAFVAAFPVLSVVAIICSFLAGWAIDRWSALTVLPLYLVPMAIGLVLIALNASIWIVPVAFVFFGATSGFGNATMGSLWPELYGTLNLGAIRALAVAGMVIASAVGPGVTGLLIDTGVAFETQCLWMAAYMVIIAAVLAVYTRRTQMAVTN
ncbi:MAG: MFS transporter [Alphaproteobacteria bacterium]